MDDLYYDELIIKENRSFCKIFIDKLKITQMIIEFFFNNNWILLKPIRIIYFIIRIDLYMFVNTLFYNEEYVRDLYYSDKEETFLSFIPISLNRIIYTFIASGVLNFIISLLFPTENKIKNNLLRKKNLKEIKSKLFFSTKNIISNYWIFIIINYILTIFCWYYISCFNNVYLYLKIEWIKSSIFIILIIQLRMSIKFKSEKIYRLSNYFSN